MLIKKKKKKSLYAEEASTAKSDGVASWAITDRSQFRALAKSAKTEGMRAPEFWVAEDERRTIRFVDDDARVVFKMYNVMRGGKPMKYIQPPEGEPDLFASVMGLRASTYFLFRIIDVDGYTPKKGPNKGKKVTNQPKFYIVGSRQYEQIRLQCIEVTGQPLNSGNVIVVRSGSGKNTVYTFIPRPGGLTPAMKSAILKFPKWKDYYKPLSVKQQREVVASMGGDVDGDDDSED